MQIITEYGQSYAIDDLTAAIAPRYSWFYHIEENDFMMRPITLLEQTDGHAVEVQVGDRAFLIPSSWHMMVVDEETLTVDTVQIAQCASSGFKTLLVTPYGTEHKLSPVVLRDFHLDSSCVHVTIPRGHMALHPVGTMIKRPNGELRELSCLISPLDLLKNTPYRTVAEVLM